MHSKALVLPLLTLCSLACSSESDTGTDNQSSAGAGVAAGSAGQLTGAGGGSAGAAPSSTDAGASSAGVGAGGGPAGGAPGAAGSSAGGSPETAGTSEQGGAPGGELSASSAVKALDGLRVDAPCAGTPATTDGAVCSHVELTPEGGLKVAKKVTVGGNPGTTYDVTLRVRGIVEPSNIVGGVRADTSTFQYKNLAWRKVPFTIGGTVTQADYSQWRISVASPKADYYLNDYQRAGHYIFKLDYEVTVPVAANTQVTLDAADSNERQIVNFEKYAFDGIPGSMNFGQFVQVNVVSVKAR